MLTVAAQFSVHAWTHLCFSSLSECVCLKAAGIRGSGNDSVSAAVRNSNPSDLGSESPASQLSLCLWHPTQPLRPPLPPLPLKAATQEIERCFQTKTREERRAQAKARGKKGEVVKGRVMERFEVKNCFQWKDFQSCCYKNKSLSLLIQEIRQCLLWMDDPTYFQIYLAQHIYYPDNW